MRNYKLQSYWNEQKIKISPDVDFKTGLTSCETSDHWRLLLTSPRAAGAQCLRRTFTEMSEFRLKVYIWKFDFTYLKPICPALPKVVKYHALQLKITRSLFCYLFCRDKDASNAPVWGILSLQIFVFYYTASSYCIPPSLGDHTESWQVFVLHSPDLLRCMEVWTWGPAWSLPILAS